MTKQDLARKRNYFKFTLLGTHLTNIDNSILTDLEQHQINGIRMIIASIKGNFDNSSREMGLKVPEYRCWCGKEGKYITNERNRELGYEIVCKKHLDDIY